MNTKDSPLTKIRKPHPSASCKFEGTCPCGQPQLSCSQSLVHGAIAMGEEEGGVISNADVFATESEFSYGHTQVYTCTVPPAPPH